MPQVTKMKNKSRFVQFCMFAHSSCCLTTCASFCIIVRHIVPSGSKTASAATTPRPRLYLWWNPCLLSLAFFLNYRWRRPANFLSKLHHSSLVAPAFTTSKRVRLFANSTKGMFLLEESWKWFQEAESFSGEKARGGRGGSVPKSTEDDPFGKCYVARVWAHCEPSWHKSIKLRQSGRGARRASGLQGVNLESRELVQLVRVGDSDVLGEGG